MLSIIVAKSRNNVIGNNNTMLWKLPDDLKRFKEKTTGHVIIMGRKTFESLGRVLPNRKHIILSRNKNFKVDSEDVKVIHSVDELNEYINNYLKNNSIVDSLSHCGNKVIDDILNIEFSKCKKENIDLDTKIIVPPTLNINPVDLCSLIMNIVDNALNEVKKIEKKKIFK